MSCRDDRDSFVTVSRGDLIAAGERVRKELDPLLCEACTLLEEAGFLGKASAELLRWYKSHEKCEEDRVRYEAALKLSERERRLFGIDLQVLKAKAKK